jgi:hypothetical protein
MESKFCLGDKVKVIGSSIVGNIVAVYNGSWYRNGFVQRTGSAPHAWDDDKPDWDKYPVYFVFYSEPQWTLTKEEYCMQLLEQHPTWPVQYIEDSYDIAYLSDLRNKRYYMAHMEHQLEGVYAENISD